MVHKMVGKDPVSLEDSFTGFSVFFANGFFDA
ncbi:hypothetical protein SMWOGL2_07470 [Sporomusa malonica]